MSYTNGPTVVKDNLILYYNGFNPKCYSSGNTNLVDMSINRKSMTLTGSYNFGQNYVRFNNGYISGGPDDSLYRFNAGDSVTISTWVRYTGNFSEDRGCMFTIGGDNSVSRDRNLQIRIENTTTNGELGFIYRNDLNTTWNIYESSSQSLFPNQWVNVTWRYGYTTGSSIELYLNNTKKTDLSWVQGNGNQDPIIPPSVFFIGVGEDANGEEFKGDIGTILLYRDYLTRDQMTQNYNAFKSRYGL